jgi:hypothetical protein
MLVENENFYPIGEGVYYPFSAKNDDQFFVGQE